MTAQSNKPFYVSLLKHRCDLKEHGTLSSGDAFTPRHWIHETPHPWSARYAGIRPGYRHPIISPTCVCLVCEIADQLPWLPRQPVKSVGCEWRVGSGSTQTRVHTVFSLCCLSRRRYDVATSHRTNYLRALSAYELSGVS